MNPVISGRPDLQNMIALGKKNHEVDLFGIKVQVRLLKVGETLETMKACNGMDIFYREKALKVETLSRAVTINGMPFPNLEVGIEFFRELEDPVLEAFNELYVTMRQLQQVEVSQKQTKKEEGHGQQKSA